MLINKSGYRFSKLGKGLHPAIGLRTIGESIAVNFTGPFMFDIDGYVRDTRDSIWRQATKDQVVNNVPRLVDQVFKRNEEDDMDIVDIDDDANGKEKPEVGETKSVPSSVDLPAHSPLHDTLSKTTAALVLDHLQNNGHDKALSMLRSSMQKRGWLAGTSIGSDIVIPTDTTTSSALSSPTPLTPRLTNFSSRFAALAHIRRVLAGSFVIPVPWSLIADLDPSSVLTSSENPSLRARLRIHHFLHLVYVSSINDGNVTVNDDGDKVDEAISSGRELLSTCRKERWNVDDARMLHEAFGALGVPSFDHVQGEWKVRREKLADDVVLLLKRESHLPTRYINPNCAL